MMGAVSRIVSDTLLYPARRVKTTRQTLASRVSTGQMTQKEAVRPVSSCWIQSLASMRSGFRTVAFLVFLSLIPYLSAVGCVRTGCHPVEGDARVDRPHRERERVLLSVHRYAIIRVCSWVDLFLPRSDVLIGS
jgi:hypothetical protein